MIRSKGQTFRACVQHTKQFLPQCFRQNGRDTTSNVIPSSPTTTSYFVAGGSRWVALCGTCEANEKPVKGYLHICLNKYSLPVFWFWCCSFFISILVQRQRKVSVFSTSVAPAPPPMMFDIHHCQTPFKRPLSFALQHLFSSCVWIPHHIRLPLFSQCKWESRA